MTLPLEPNLLSVAEFIADPLGIDTAQLLKLAVTLSAQGSIGAAALTTTKANTAPASTSPAALAIATYAAAAGDPCWIGAGTAADPLELTYLTGPLVDNGGTYTVNIAPVLAALHPVGSPLTVGALQQRLLSAAGVCESFCGQPIAATTHPTAAWPLAAQPLALSGQYFAVDRDGYLEFLAPYVPIVSVASVQYRRTPADVWTSIDASAIEQLRDRVRLQVTTFRRWERVVFKVGYVSGYAVTPSDTKEAVRETAASFIRQRGGSAVVSGSGNKVIVKDTKSAERDLPPGAKAILMPYRAVR